jgi:hypothetical protein
MLLGWKQVLPLEFLLDNLFSSPPPPLPTPIPLSAIASASRVGSYLIVWPNTA